MKQKIKLHIHFGIHRTGTTSIHRNLVSNLDLLKKHNILYPELGFNHRHVKLAWHLISKKISPEEVLTRLKKEINTETKLIILSSEDFVLINNDKWLKLLQKEFDITASIYLKEQRAWLESWYNQNIKWPWNKKFSTATPEYFLKNIDDFYWIDYYKTLSKLRQLLGREALYVNVVAKEHVIDTTADLFAFLNLDFIDIEQAEQKNISVSYAKLQLLRQIDLFDFKPGQRTRLLNNLKDFSFSEDNGDKRVFSGMQVRSIYDKYENSNALVAKEFFARNELFTKQELNQKIIINNIDKDVVINEIMPQFIKYLVTIKRKVN